MLNSSQLTRSAVIAATLLAIAAGSAGARPTDVPLRPEPAATTAARTQRWTPPRVDGMGVQPADHAAATPGPPAVALTRASDGAADHDWVLIAIGASAMLALLLLVAVFRTDRHWAHPFRARQV